MGGFLRIRSRFNLKPLSVLGSAYSCTSTKSRGRATALAVFVLLTLSIALLFIVFHEELLCLIIVSANCICFAILIMFRRFIYTYVEQSACQMM